MSVKDAMERGLRHSFRYLGSVIGRYPTTVLLLSLLTTFIFSIGLLWFEEVNNVRTEYSPMDSPSRKEYEVAENFLNQVKLILKLAPNLLCA